MKEYSGILDWSLASKKISGIFLGFDTKIDAMQTRFKMSDIGIVLDGYFSYQIVDLSNISRTQAHIRRLYQTLYINIKCVFT